jgi:hypothetical protein
MLNRNSGLPLAMVALLGIVISAAYAQGHNSKFTGDIDEHQGKQLMIGDVASGQAPVQSQVVEVKLWNTAHAANELQASIDEAVQRGEMKTSKPVDVSLQRLKDLLRDLGRASDCKGKQQETIFSSVHGPRADAPRSVVSCTCHWDLSGPCGCTLILDRMCPVHGSSD